MDVDRGRADFDPVTRFLVRRWKGIVVAAWIGGVAGFAGASFVPRVYRAEVLIAPATQSADSTLQSLVGRYGALANMAGVTLPSLGSDVTSTDTVVALLRSYGFLTRFIGGQELAPILFSDEWDPSTKTWRDSNDVPTMQDAYETFARQILTVVEDRENNLLRVRIEWRDPVEAANWANELVRRVNETARARVVEETERSVEFLERELQGAEALPLRQSIFALLQTQLNRRMLANSRPDFAFTVVDAAHASDSDRYVWPVRSYLAALGLFCGLFIGLAAASVTEYRSALSSR